MGKRASILTTIAFVTLLGILVADFLDNGVINNRDFLIISLFVFSGAGAGRTVDAIIERYIGKENQNENKGSNRKGE